MSAMKELYLKVAADSVLQDKVNKIIETASEDADAVAAKLVEFAKEEGYDITAEEIGEFFKSLSKTSNETLDDNELEAVAGGKGGIGIINSSLINPNACGGKGGGILASILSLGAASCR